MNQYNTIKIEIIKTRNGYNFRNMESRKLVGTIHEGKNKPGIYRWETFGQFGFSTLAKSVNFIKLELMNRAEQLCCEIEFVNK